MTANGAAALQDATIGENADYSKSRSRMAGACVSPALPASTGSRRTLAKIDARQRPVLNLQRAAGWPVVGIDVIPVRESKS